MESEVKGSNSIIVRPRREGKNREFFTWYFMLKPTKGLYSDEELVGEISFDHDYPERSPTFHQIKDTDDDNFLFYFINGAARHTAPMP